MKILGYGEDAFTLLTLQKHGSRILEALGEGLDSDNCLAFFRPSFGRGGKNRSEIGEFDVILATINNVYLIENKWDNFTVTNKKVIALKREQILRHKLFSWYYTNWNIHQYKNWTEFVKQKSNIFSKIFSNKSMPRQETLLARNLETVLKKLHECRTKFIIPRNVLLYFHGAQSQEIERVESGRLKFEVINIDYSKFTTNSFTANNFTIL